jgi:hypothetical protein
LCAKKCSNEKALTYAGLTVVRGRTALTTSRCHSPGLGICDISAADEIPRGQVKAEQPLWPGATYNVIFASCSLPAAATDPHRTLSASNLSVPLRYQPLKTRNICTRPLAPTSTSLAISNCYFQPSRRGPFIRSREAPVALQFDHSGTPSLRMPSNTRSRCWFPGPGLADVLARSCVSAQRDRGKMEALRTARS